jgi:hypothetical protein
VVGDKTLGKNRPCSQKMTRAREAEKYLYVAMSIAIIRLEGSAAAPRGSGDRSTASTYVTWRPSRGGTLCMVVFVGYGVARVA